MSKTVVIQDEEHTALGQLAKVHRRSMTQELGVLIEAAYKALPLKSFSTKSPSEVLADMKPTDPVVKAFEGDND